MAVFFLALMAAWYLGLGLNRLFIVDRCIAELPSTIISGLSEPWTEDVGIPGLKSRSSRQRAAAGRQRGHVSTFCKSKNPIIAMVLREFY